MRQKHPHQDSWRRVINKMVFSAGYNRENSPLLNQIINHMNLQHIYNQGVSCRNFVNDQLGVL